MLKCPNSTIEIQDASYGRKSPSICKENTWFTACKVNVTQHVRKICENKESCVVTENDILSKVTDPCQSIEKYINIKYKCKSSNDTIGKLFRLFSRE